MSPVEQVLLDLTDWFSEMDDNEDAPFGTYARVTHEADRLLVLHESEDWGVEIVVRQVEAGQ